MNNKEQTLSIIKPDAVERNLSDEIKNIFTKNNLNILESKKNIYINDYLNLDLVFNTGIGFGLLSFNENLYYNLVTILIIIVIIII